MKKLLYLLLLTPIIYLASCSKSTVTPEVESLYGCMDSLAFNYDTLANTNDSSCCYVAGCTDPIALNYDANACYDDTSCTYPLAIGVTHQGGIIFYILQQGDIGYVAGQFNGLIAAPSDLSSNAEWGCCGTLISGADGTAIGTGTQNTIDIEAGCTVGVMTTSLPKAFNICANYTDGTYSDWFLPSKDELTKMYLNIGQGNALGLGNIGGFASNGYWSSTELDSDGAWFQNFANGFQYFANKGYYSVVRAVRAF